MSRSRALLSLVLVAVVAGACSTSGLSIRTDERLEIVEPPDRAEVELPFTVRWTIEDFDLTGPTPTARKDAGYFAVFVDTAPPPPNETVAWLFRDDDACRAQPGCPDAQDLADRDVFTTSETSLRIASLPDTAAEGERELHNVTIVLLDGTGRRIGESAFAVDVRVKRDG